MIKNYDIGSYPDYYDLLINKKINEQNLNNIILLLNNFKNLKKIIIYNIEIIKYEHDKYKYYYFHHYNENIIKILKEYFDQKIEINLWKKN